MSTAAIIRRGLLVVAVAAMSGALASASASAKAHSAAPRGGPRTSTPLKPPASARPAAASMQRGTVASSNKVKHCGTELTKPGTYNVTKDMTDTNTSSGAYCIWIAHNNITLNMNGHTITGNGSYNDYCIQVWSVGPSVYTNVKNDVINGGGHLDGCEYGIYGYYTQGMRASNLKIVPGSSSAEYGVDVEYGIKNVLKNITVNDASYDVTGIELDYGTGNRVLGSKVLSTSSPDFFYTYYEYGDVLSGDTATDSSGAGDGTGFDDEYSNHNQFLYDKALGQDYGFYLSEDSYGVVTARHNLAKNSGSSNEYGFYTYENYDASQSYNPRRPHSVYSANVAKGVEYGFYEDYYDVGAHWNHNVAKNVVDEGFYADYPAANRYIDNTASGPGASTSNTYGFYLEENYGEYKVKRFNGNVAKHWEYGFYSDYAQRGKNNYASHNTYNSEGVEING